MQLCEAKSPLPPPAVDFSRIGIISLGGGSVEMTGFALGILLYMHPRPRRDLRIEAVQVERRFLMLQVVCNDLHCSPEIHAGTFCARCKQAARFCMVGSLDQSAAERAHRAAATDGAKYLLFGHSVIGPLTCVCVCTRWSSLTVMQLGAKGAARHK